MKKRKILAALTAAAWTTAMLTTVPLTVRAAGYTAVHGDVTDFDKYLVMDEGANVPHASFAYTVTSGSPRSFHAENSTIAVYPGPTPEKIIFSGTDVDDEITTDGEFTISFSPQDSTTLFADRNVSDDVKNLDEGEQYAKKTAKLDFSNVTFDEPGIYRYIITETDNGAQGILYDANPIRVLDVYVTDVAENETPTLAVSAYILHASDENISINGTTYGSDGQVIAGENSEVAQDVTSDYKSQGFTNEYTTHDLTFSKQVSGNQASKDKYFAFTVSLKNAVKGTVYTLSYLDDNNDNTTDGSADAVIPGNPNSATTVIPTAVTQPETLTAGEDGTVEQTFYLRHHQKIVIRGIADGTVYTITDGKEDYAPSYTTNDNMDVTETKLDTAANLVGLTDDVTVDFTNTRDGLIPTGIILAVAAPVTIAFVVLAGIIFLTIKNQRRAAEEE